MATLEVLRFPDERLRTIAQEVTHVDDQVRVIIKDMLETMYDENGIAGINKVRVINLRVQLPQLRP